MKFAPYSFSKISTHKQCNRKFKYSYIDKAPQCKQDTTALLKGGAVHSIFEHFPNSTNHKLASQYQHIADAFVRSRLGEKYLTRDSIREFKFGMNSNLEPCEYKDKNAVFKGSVDFICIIDIPIEETIEVDSLNDIPEGYEIIEVFDK